MEKMPEGYQRMFCKGQFDGNDFAIAANLMREMAEALEFCCKQLDAEWATDSEDADKRLDPEFLKPAKVLKKWKKWK